MFGFLGGLLSLLKASSSKVALNKEKRVQRQQEIKSKYLNHGSQSGVEEGQKEKELKEQSARAKVLTAVSFIIAFFETLPVFLALVLWSLVILCVIVTIVVLFSFLASLRAIPDWEIEQREPSQDNPCGTAIIATGGVLAWSDEELASRGANLSDYEKNLYRLGILSRKAAEGYGGEELMTPDGADINLRTLFLLGVASTETSMRFYTGGANHDITRVPSNISSNYAGYGFMGINVRRDLNFYYPSNVVSNIRREYVPSSTPSYTAAFPPYGVAMSAMHKHRDFKQHMKADKIRQIERIADEWGIQANKPEFVAMTQFFLVQAHYHGTVYSDYEGFINFFAALFHATSENDAERTFHKWGIQHDSSTSSGDFSESGIRQSFIGSGGMRGVARHSSPSGLSGLGNTKVTLNGQPLSVPVWKFLGDKYMDRKGFQESWRLIRHYSSRTGGIGDRVLNFHYGFNSFIQGKRVEAILAEKMNVVGSAPPASSEPSQGGCPEEGATAVPGEFTPTPGKGQAIVNGKPMDQYMDEWLQGKTGSVANLIRQLRPTWGKSEYLENPDSVARKSGYVDKHYGVPFYGQGRRYNESYGNISWYPGARTYNASGCMVYSHAYVASALTGTLINPSEMGSLMLTTNSIVSVGIAGSTMPRVYEMLGLNATYYATTRERWGNSTKPTAMGRDIATTVKGGGLAVVRFTGPRFSSGVNHFVTITNVENRNGVDYWTMYSSYSTTDSSQQFTTQYLLNNGNHRDVVMIWK